MRWRTKIEHYLFSSNNIYGACNICDQNENRSTRRKKSLDKGHQTQKAIVYDIVSVLFKQDILQSDYCSKLSTASHFYITAHENYEKFRTRVECKKP